MRRTLGDFIKGLMILSKYYDCGMDERFFCDAQHDVIYLYVNSGDLPENSEDGKALIELGFHTDDQ